MQFPVGTPVGPAHVELEVPQERPGCLLVLGHGAGGGVDAADLLAVRDVVLAHAVAVARVTQPYRVAGRRAPAPARQLDVAWTSVIAELRTLDGCRDVPLIVGGRSSGARVACRTVRATGAAGVVALAFPLHPPGRPERSRAAELPTDTPTIVVNGERDPFGVPDASPAVVVEVIPGADHALRRGTGRAAELVLDWLVGHGWARRRAEAEGSTGLP